MRKVYTLLFLALVLVTNAKAQSVKSSIGRTSTPNTIGVWIMPDATNASATVSTLQFNLAYDNTIYTGPPPTLTITSSNPIFSTPITWIVAPPAIDPAYPNYVNYYITNAQAGYTANFMAGVEQEVLQVTATSNGAPFNVEDLFSLTLPDGGSGAFALFYLTGTLNSNGSDLYYDHAGTGSYTHMNGFSYTADPDFGNPVGTDISYSKFGNTPLATDAITLEATCTIGQINLSAKTIGNLNNLSHVEMASSADGVNFETLTTLSVNNNGVFDFTPLTHHIGIAKYRAIAHYKDGKTIQSNIAYINCDQNNVTCNIYPNPTTDYVKVVTNQANNQISVYANNGQLIRQVNSKGQEQKISLKDFTDGLYLIRVTNADGVFTQQTNKRSN
jgi:hypothetical protein